MTHMRARMMAEVAGGTGVRPRRSGFTLLELLVAVGALAFVAVGIAAIFESTGRTISAGKRVSAFTSYANLIEQQMRADFAAMTRDGFLVIRNEYAGADPQGSTPDAVALHSEDTNPRPRRIDQLMFFAKGQFTSAREPLNEEFTPRSDTARIYYGHGQRESSASARFLAPTLNDSNAPTIGQRRATRLGYADPNGTNPNLYASDWTLLRHVTLLRQPQTSPTVNYASELGGQSPFKTATVDPKAYPDSDVQIALQPAASGVFRRLLTLYPNTTTSSTTLPVSLRSIDLGAGPNPTNPPSPVFSSGLVDIATTDLTEIRQVVVTADTWPLLPSGAAGPTRLAGVNFWKPMIPFRADGQNEGPDGVFRLWDQCSPTPVSSTGAQPDADVLRRMQAWIDDAWPSDATQARALERDRVRCEATPLNFLGAPVGARDALDATTRTADQMMLTSSNFLPRCTEFIVEWSFGDTYTNDPNDTNYALVQGLGGQVVWHGMLRRTSTGQLIGQGPSNGAQVPAVYPYLDRTMGSALAKIDSRSLAVRTNEGSTFQHLIRTAMIHGEDFANVNQGSWAAPADPLTSYFGYVDPTFNPDQQAVYANGSWATPRSDGKVDGPKDAASSTLPWAWPKLIRVTLSLADPNDPKVERTFQFTFDVPEPKR